MDDEEAWQQDKSCWPASHSSQRYDRFVSYNMPPVKRSKAPIWRQIWNKFKKEKKRIFHCSNSMRFTYDPHSYSQNFDHGFLWEDHDDHSRSFSARFAVPSRIFDSPRLMV